MAENNGQNFADLERILATLASLPQTANVPPQDQQHVYDPAQSYAAFQDAPQIYPQEQNTAYRQSADPRLHGRPALQHPPRPQGPPSTPLIDPSTITEWKQGLRCVSKIAAHNPNFAASVRKLMKDQEQNVASWESGRTRVIEDHKFKRENEQTLRAALSLPGLLADTAPIRTLEKEQEELEQYDAKVYRASKLMVGSQTSSLKVLGVPFFGVKPDLVLDDDDDEEPLVTGQGSQVAGKITKKQVLELQRKMLNHLLELYGD
ncbi:hypothetical protein P153DRAFT_307777 [Dothidotthia symphoricarpi CBS 119687]|uniref:Uncharacterized protein n=1 Tax=Dothidotthia symphoricarpi CBS 119687 TaxID=1392245 RepID=A0A6A6AQB4_9PLEO|nr:uncharacterized protein P153DRAFT_307777 [Dothidotthia symphoricarpi CBS 119687]KAF2133205.1 hypothetical protein P153DRAFT_307777 [Dothidotthia symphoricarpi CBS 119687]